MTKRSLAVSLLGALFIACGGRTDGVTDGGNAFALGGSGGAAGQGSGDCQQGLACPAGKACSVAVGSCATTCKCDSGGHYACTTECATGGSGGAAGNPSYSQCSAPGQCQVASTTCCGSCGKPSAAGSIAIANDHYSEYLGSVCGGGPIACPACASAPNNDLAAFCRTEECGLVEVSKDVISSCNTDADCVLRRAGCCDCPSPNADDYIALATAGAPEYTAQLCGQGYGCDCAGNSPPPGLAATCNPSTKHCQVAKGTTLACPTAAPLQGTACTPPASGVCEYGTSLVIGCRQHYTCVFGSWQLQTGQYCPPIDNVGVNGCPPVTSASGQACFKEGQVCALPGSSVCDCTACGGGGPCMTTPTWECAGPPGGGCPNLAPDTGQTCAAPGIVCSYGAPCSLTSATRQCSGGVWVDLPVACEG
jgi:hypothetical protein